MVEFYTNFKRKYNTNENIRYRAICHDALTLIYILHIQMNCNKILTFVCENNYNYFIKAQVHKQQYFEAILVEVISF